MSEDLEEEEEEEELNSFSTKTAMRINGSRASEAITILSTQYEGKYNPSNSYRPVSGRNSSSPFFCSSSPALPSRIDPILSHLVRDAIERLVESGGTSRCAAQDLGFPVGKRFATVSNGRWVGGQERRGSEGCLGLTR